MPDEKLYACRYSRCKHPNLMLPEDQMERRGNFFYHPDCIAERETIDDIIRIYSEEIDSAVVFKYLRSVINNIIFVKGVSAEYLLFAIKYAIRTKRTIRSPAYLHYLVSDGRIKNAFQKSKTIKPIEPEIQFKDIAAEETEFTPSSIENKSGFTKIFAKGSG